MMTTQQTYRRVALIFLCVPSFLVGVESEKDRKVQKNERRQRTRIIQFVGANSRELGKGIRQALLTTVPPVKFFVNKVYLEKLIKPLGYSSDADWSVANENNGDQTIGHNTEKDAKQDGSALANLYHYTRAIVTHPEQNLLQLKIAVNAENNPLVQEVARYKKLVGRYSTVAWAGLIVTILGTAIVAPLITTEVIKRAWVAYTLTGLLGTMFATTLGSAGTAYYYSCYLRQCEQQLLGEGTWMRAKLITYDDQSRQLISKTNHNLFATKIALNELNRDQIQQLIVRVEGDTNIKVAESPKNVQRLLAITFDSTTRIEDILTDLLMVDGGNRSSTSSSAATTPSQTRVPDDEENQGEETS